MKTNKTKTERPLLRKLIADGIVSYPEEGGEVVGRAADGVEVTLGHTDDLDAVESYLRERPTPDRW